MSGERFLNLDVKKEFVCFFGISGIDDILTINPKCLNVNTRMEQDMDEK